MKEIAAYMLLVLGGNDSPSAADIAAVLEAGGQTADSKAAGLADAFESEPAHAQGVLLIISLIASLVVWTMRHPAARRWRCRTPSG